jgi:hypothetical protein
MQLNELDKGIASEQRVKATPEYQQLAAANDPAVAYVACILVLRGDFVTLDEAVAQAKQQMRVVETAVNELVKKDTQMWWRPSGPTGLAKTSNDFIKFVRNGEKLVFRSPTTKMNCWEVVISAGMLAGEITDLSQLQRLYQGTQQQFTNTLVKSFNGYKKHTYDPTRKKGGFTVPAAADYPMSGDIVLFNGLDHVTLATGQAAAGPVQPPHLPGQEIISFWPAPRLTDFGEDTPAMVEYTTIESIQQWGQTNLNGMEVTFGSPDWRALNG